MTEIDVSSLQSQIDFFTEQLASSQSPIGDWKIAKVYEARLKGIEDPYDVDKLIADRQAARDTINDLQKRIEEIRNANE